MLKLAGVLFVALPIIVGSCTTTAGPSVAKPTTVPQTAQAPVSAPSIETGSAPTAAVQSRPKLGPGQCEDGFDCVDTVGFPPDGYRWTCVQGKCGRAKLPNLGALGAPEKPVTAEAKADEDKPESKRKTSRMR